MQPGTVVSVIADPAEAGDFAAQWARFAEAHARSATAFQTPGWLLPIIGMHSRKGGSHKNRLVVVEDRRGLAVVAPFSLASRGGVGVLEWLGEPMLGYGDVLARPDCDVAGLLALALESLKQRGDRIDALHLRKVPQQAAVRPFLEAKGLAPLEERCAPYADLGAFATFDDYLATRNRRSVKGYRRKRRKLEEQGAVHFKVFMPGEEAQALGRTALAMKIAWMKAHGLVSRMFADPDRLEALIAIVGQAHSGARVSGLFIGDRPIALEIGFIEGKVYYSFIGAIDLEYAQISPGNLQIIDAIHWCHRNGIESFDFLTPDSDYKRSWCTDAQAAHDFCCGITLAGRLYATVYIRTLHPLMVKAHGSAPSMLRRLSKYWLSHSRGPTDETATEKD